MSEIDDLDPRDILPEGGSPLAAIIPVAELFRLRGIERAAQRLIESIDDLVRLDGPSATMHPERWASVAALRAHLEPLERTT
jgi:hypothetical protein